MDVVADRRAIRRRVVVAEQRERRAALDREQRVRDEVRLGPVDLAKPLRRARDVEVPQDHAPEPVRLAVPVEGALERPLRLAVRVDRAERVVLLDRRSRRDAVGRRRRAEHEAPHAGLAGGLEQGDPAGHVVAVVPRRVPAALADERSRRAVEDRVDAARPREAPARASPSPYDPRTRRAAGFAIAVCPVEMSSRITTSWPASTSASTDTPPT